MGVSVTVFVDVLVGVSVGVNVDVLVAVTLDVLVGVDVGDWQKVDIVAGAVPPPEVSNSNVPNRPLVLIWVDAPAFSWKLLVAIGVPFSSKVHVPLTSHG